MQFWKRSPPGPLPRSRTVLSLQLLSKPSRSVWPSHLVKAPDCPQKLTGLIEEALGEDGGYSPHYTERKTEAERKWRAVLSCKGLPLFKVSLPSAFRLI